MPGTEDLFTPIHKTLRSMIYQLGGRLQRNDFADLSATTALVTDLELDFAVARSAGCLVCVLHHHAEDEETAIFPHVEKVASKLTRELIDEHHELTRRELAIEKSAHELLRLGEPDERVRAGVVLNQAADQLFAAYLTHMNREEAELVPLMKDKFTDPEMAAMRGKIMGAMPPDRLMAILGWMVPSLNPTELAGFLGALQQGAPPPVLTAVYDLCAARLEPARWADVRARVGS